MCLRKDAWRIKKVEEESSGVERLNPGFIPIQCKCLVLPDEAVEKIGSIVVPDSVRDKQKMRTVKATFVAAGGNAFEDYAEPVPVPGDRIYVAVGAGIIHKGPDGREYRIVNDDDIAGILTEDTEEQAKVSGVVW